MSNPTTPATQASGELLSREETIQLVLQQLQVLSAQIDSYTQSVTGEDLTNWMQELNLNLRVFPDIVHILTDEQIAPLYKGMLLQKGIVFEKAKEPKAPKPKAPKVKSTGLVFKGAAPSIDLSDL